MSATIGLSAYLLRVKKVHAREWSVFKRGGEVDLYAMVKDFVERMVAAPLRGDKAQYGHVVKLDRLLHREADGILRGRFLCGDCGRASSIIDTVTNKETHKKTKTEADMPPYYFYVRVPNGGDTRALMILQRIGINGVKGTLEINLKRYFHKKELTLDVSVLTNAELLKKYLTKGEMKEIRVLTHKKIHDHRDLLKNSRIDGERIENGTEVEVILRHKRGVVGNLKNAFHVRSSPSKVKELIEVHGLEDPDEVAVKMEFENKVRTFKLLHPNEAGIVRDITDEVDLEAETNQPTLESMHKIVTNWANELWKDLEDTVAG